MNESWKYLRDITSQYANFLSGKIDIARIIKSVVLIVDHKFKEVISLSPRLKVRFLIYNYFNYDKVIMIGIIIITHDGKGANGEWAAIVTKFGPGSVPQIRQICSVCDHRCGDHCS